METKAKLILEHSSDQGQTWEEIDRFEQELPARRKAALLYGKAKASQFRVRDTERGFVLFEIGGGKVKLHPSIAPKKNN